MCKKNIQNTLDICSLTDDEVRQIVTDMFNPARITNIRRHKREGYVSCTMYSKWTSYDENGKEDTVTCKDDVEIHDPFEYYARPITCSEGFPVRAEDIIKLKQFCFSKGLMPEWMRNNPYACRAQK